MWYIYMYNGILLSYNKERNNVIYSHMHGPRDYHAKSDKVKYHISLICGI